MFNKFTQLFICVLLFNVCVIHAQSRKLICYHGSWAAYRQGNGRFTIDNINPHICTHLIYSFAGVNSDGTIKVLDPWLDIDLGGYTRFNKLKLVNPNLKTLIAVGGWSEGSTKYSLIASKPQFRQNFINSAINLLQTYNFDGIDMDWEYPGQRGGAAIDKANFATWIQELRNAFGTRYLLTIAVGATASMVDTSYNVPLLSANVDFINVMTYDLHGPWEQNTGANSPLYSSQLTDPLTVSKCISYWISKGALRSKLILGVPIYGRTYTLKDVNKNYVGAPTNGSGNPGPYTEESGILGYNEIYEYIITNQWTQRWDDVQKVPFMYKGNQWISYDNQRSVALKVNYSISEGLGGVMVWSIETDPVYLASNLNYPILRTIQQGLL